MQEQFSFKNPSIQRFFDTGEDPCPTSELMYLHTHPLIKPNFITDINDLINLAGEKLVRKKIKGQVIDEFSRLCLEIGTEIPTLSNESAKKVLFSLKEIRDLCNKIIKDL